MTVFEQVFHVTQQTSSGLYRFIVDVSRSHTLKTHPVGVGTSDHPVAKTTRSTCTTHKHKRRTSMLSAGFESAIPEIQLPQTDPLDHGREIGERSRGEVHPITGHKGPGGEGRCSSTFLNFATRSEWVVNDTPRTLYLR